MTCLTVLLAAIFVHITSKVCSAEHASYMITSHKASGNLAPHLYIAPVTSAVPSTLSFDEISGTGTVQGNNYRITGLTFDPVAQQVYWVERDADKVKRGDISGTTMSVSNVVDIDSSATDAREVCLDIYNRVIYWTLTGNDGSVMTRPMDLSTGATLVPGSNGIGSFFHDCVYGPISQSLYLAYAGGAGSTSDGFIVKLPVDGISPATPETLDTGLPQPVAIDVDEEAGELFYGMYNGGNSPDTIKKYDLNANPPSPSTTVFSGRTGGLRGFAIYHDLIYAADFDDNTNNVYTVPRSGSTATELTMNYQPGEGDQIQNVIFVTACPSSVCTACVQNVAVTADSANQMTVTWDAPMPSVCNADYYKVTAVPSNIDQCNGVASDSDTKTIDWQTETSIQITDLLPNTDYDITVIPGLTDRTDSSVINPGTSVDVSQTTSATVSSGIPGLSIPTATDNSVTLAFTEPPCGSQNGEILSYRSYCSNGLTRTLEQSTPADTPSVTVTGLSCDSQYTCYVAAVTDMGIGPYAEIIIDGSIASSVPTSPPCNLMITEATSSSITFAWEKCACGTRGGVTQSYTYRLLSNGRIITSRETSDLTVTFDDIPVCADDYIFEVATETSAGIGPYAQEDFRGDAGLGVEPVINSSRISFDEVLIEIMENPCVLDEAVIISYVYTLKRLSNIGQTEIVATGEVDAELDWFTKIQLGGLECSSTYQLCVAGKTAIGDGLETTFDFVTENSPNPFLPGSSLVIRKVSSSTTIVSWETSLSACPSSEFVVEYRLVNLEQCDDQLLDTWTRISTRDSEITLNNLNAGSTYAISVTGQTSSDVDVALQDTWTTPDSAPRWPPTDINVVRYNPSDLVIEWRAPPCGTRGGIISYEYELVTVSDQSDFAVHRGATTVNMIQIDPPSGYVNYIFRVATVNSVGVVYSNTIKIEATNDPVPTGLCPDGFCFNGGTCFSDNSESLCRCQSRYSGVRCEEQSANIGLCPDGYCFNGGTCFSDNSESLCRCQSGYSGLRCEEEPANKLDDGVIIAIALFASVTAITAAAVSACVFVLRRRRLLQASIKQPQMYQPPITYYNPSFQLGY